MPLHSTIIGTLSGDPTEVKTGTRWKVNTHGAIITVFTVDNAFDARDNFSSGDRVRAEGRLSWNQWQDKCDLVINGAVDLSEKADELTLKADGSFNHDLDVEKDDDGSFIRVKLECPARKKNAATGDWEDALDIVLIRAEGECVKKLQELHEDGVTNFSFTGYLDKEPEYIEDSDDPGFYMEAETVDVGATRSESNFWNEGGAKSRGLKNRKTVTPKASPKKRGGSGGSSTSSDPDDPMPF